MGLVIYLMLIVAFLCFGLSIGLNLSNKEKKDKVVRAYANSLLIGGWLFFIFELLLHYGTS